MSLSIISKYIFTYYTVIGFIPAAILCYLPMRNQLRRPPRKIAIHCILLFVVCYIGLQAFNAAVPTLDGTIMMVPFLVIVFIYYIFSVRANIAACVGIFVSACTLCAIPVCYVYLIEGILENAGVIPPDGPAFGAIEIISMVAICVAFMPSYYDSGSYLVDRLQQKRIWVCTIPFSLLTFVLLVVLASDRYALYKYATGIEIYLILASGLTALYLFSIIFFGWICRHLTQEEKYRTREAIYQVQRKQYQELRSFLEKMHIYRHDTRHTFRTIGEMARAGDTDGILTLLDQKEKDMPQLSVREYCGNGVINAMLNYYIDEAERNHIVNEIRIDLPDLTERQAIDLTGLLANHLENAILACQEIPEEERRMALTVRTVNKKNIYIVGTNSFNGKVRMRRGEYLTTRRGRGGTGIGMTSMRNVVERYRGQMKAYHEDKTFYIDIMMNVEKQN